MAGIFSREFVFHPSRKWRLDLFCHSYRVGVELHGGIFTGGRHVNPAGFIRDREKMNAATELGIRVLEYWPQAITDGSAIAQIQRVMQAGI